ncbi:hypothetical protein RJ641_004788 [Dillenia turbinata]|uniref:Protein kinase domain-containing protein n=1 Tax=Dillenia turbinata TaxID=194707 RepID=A0AAN8VFE1_9MAGN
MFRARKAEYKSPEMLLQDKELMNMVSFTTRQLQIYSNNFSSLLGLGGFGRVYKGQLPDGQEIAVKVFASTHGMDNEGFMNEYVIENYINGEFDKVIAVCGIEKDKEKAERLCMVAFWCVQFSPDARPCMTAVVNMLEGVVEVMLPPQNLSSFGFGPSIFSSHCSSDETRSASIIGASVCRDHSKKSGLDSRFKFDGSYRGHTFEIEAVTDSSYAASSDSISEDITDVPLSRSVAETALALTLEASTSNLPPSDTISISMDAISPQVPNNVEGQPLLASDISIPSSCFKNDHQPHLVSVDAGPLVSEEVFDQSYSISDEVKMAFTDLITLLGKGLSAICQDSALSSVLRDILIFLSTLSEEDGISMAAKSLILQIQEQMGPLLLKLQGAHHIINEFEAKIKFERVMELSIMKCKEMMETMAAKLEKEQDSLAKLEVMKAEYEEKLKSINEKILVSRSAANSASQKKDKALKEVKRLGSQYEQVVSQRSALEEQNELAKEVVEEVEEKWADLKELVEQLHVSGVCV